MINQHYSFSAKNQFTEYVFISKGKEKEVTKVVQFYLDNNGFWNLGFGDSQDGEISDSVITNNHDVVKVISTVAKIVYTFFEKYPDVFVLIKPVDKRRARLYNIVFQRHFEEIKPLFEITGIRGILFEPYSVEQNYDFFIIKLR